MEGREMKDTPSKEAIIDEALDNAITALGQCQKGTARQFLLAAIDKANRPLPFGETTMLAKVTEGPAAQPQPRGERSEIVQQAVDALSMQDNAGKGQTREELARRNQQALDILRSGAASSKQKCERCGGSGWIQDSQGDNNCEACHGTGAASSEPPKEERGEWTPKQIAEALMTYDKPQLLAEVLQLNAALKSERERVLLEVSRDRTATGHASKVEQIALDLKQELKSEREVTDGLGKLNDQLHQQLLAAQAAIEKHNRDYKPHSYAIKADLSVLREHDAEVRKPYQELLYAVERRFEGETRHETALRYIREAERKDDAALASV